MLLEIILLASIGAIIGWITNVLAIKMLFRPLKPIPIPLLKIEIQGLIPKRRAEIAKSIGETIETELISIEEIAEEFLTQNRKEELIVLIKTKITNIVSLKLPLIIPSSIKNKIMEYINEQISAEGMPLLDSIIDGLMNKLKEEVKVGDIVEKKINEFDLMKIEEMILNIANTELKHIEVLGGVLGFIIGLIQGIIIQFI